MKPARVHVARSTLLQALSSSSEPLNAKSQAARPILGKLMRPTSHGKRRRVYPALLAESAVAALKASRVQGFGLEGFSSEFELKHQKLPVGLRLWSSSLSFSRI